MVRIADPGVPISEEDVARFEGRIGRQLPSRYREFLLRFNGGRPLEAEFAIGPYSLGSSSLIQEFFALKDRLASSTLGYAVSVFAGRIPASLLPIARDPGGNLICIGLEGDDRGSVFFWDHELDDSPPDFSNVSLVADSFDEFLSKLSAPRV